jgi:hypothetical protein
MLLLDEVWWRCMSVMVYGALLHNGSARLVQCAENDIRTRSMCSVERSMARLGLIGGKGCVVAVVPPRLRQAVQLLIALNNLINQR